MSLIHFFNDFFLKFREDDSTIKNVFDHYFFDLKYFLHKDASIEEFSNLLNISTDNIKKISYTYYNSSFQMLINENRYKHFINELESPVNANLSIDSIIKLCGYENSEKFVDYANAKSKHE
jgi:AraC-like DNA-binding protein